MKHGDKKGYMAGGMVDEEKTGYAKGGMAKKEKMGYAKGGSVKTGHTDMRGKGLFSSSKSPRGFS